MNERFTSESKFYGLSFLITQHATTNLSTCWFCELQKTHAPYSFVSSTILYAPFGVITYALLPAIPCGIFTSSINPSVAAASIKSIEISKVAETLRLKIRENSSIIRDGLRSVNIPFIDNESHIVPILVKGPLECKQISKLLLDDFGIYIQPVFYPTVPKGEERLRVTITPKHSKADIDNFISCINEAWNIHNFKRAESNNLNSRA